MENDKVSVTNTSLDSSKTSEQDIISVPENQQLPQPILIPPVIPPSAALPGLLAGFTRTLVTNFSIGIIGIFREAILWWFKVPIKMFRPYSVNPWMIFSELAEHQSKPYGPNFIHSTLKKEGFSILRLNVFPLMIANGLVGAVLFHSYTLSHNLLKRGGYNDYYMSNFWAGAIAGFNQTLLSVPLDNLSKSIIKGEFLKHRHIGIHSKIYTNFIEMPFNKHQRFKYLYKGVRFNMMRYYLIDNRDTLGFSMFFGVFEGLQRTGRKFTNKIWGYKHEPELSILKSDRPLSLKVTNGFVVIMSGAFAGAAFQSMVYPLDVMQRQVMVVQHSNKLYLGINTAIKMLKSNGVRFYYRGMGAKLIMAMPPSALGLFVYELSSDWIQQL
jgi:hypothetical protein